MANAKLDEKHTKIIRGLSQLPENKRCADCLAKGSVYANTTFNTFICTTCSGNSFGFRVKSLSMSNFKPEEVKALQEGGNQVAQQKWMSSWNRDDYPEPEAGDLERVRQFIRLKYVEKKWTNDRRARSNSNSRSHGREEKSSSRGSRYDDPASEPRVEPLSKILGSNIPPIRVEQGKTTQQQSQQQKSGFADFDSFDWTQNSRPQTKPASSQPQFASEPIDFFASPPPQQQQAQQNQTLHPFTQNQPQNSPFHPFSEPTHPQSSQQPFEPFAQHNQPSQPFSPFATPNPTVQQTKPTQSFSPFDSTPLQPQTQPAQVDFFGLTPSQNNNEEAQKKKEEEEKAKKANLLQQQLGQMFQSSTQNQQHMQQQQMFLMMQQQQIMQQQQMMGMSPRGNQQPMMGGNPQNMNQMFGMNTGMPPMHLNPMNSQMHGNVPQMHGNIPQMHGGALQMQGGIPQMHGGGISQMQGGQQSGWNGGNGLSLTPQEPSMPTELPKEQPKPDPFAALSPLGVLSTLGAKAPVAQKPSVSNNSSSDPFGFGPSTTTTTHNNNTSHSMMDDPFGFGTQPISQAPTQQKQQDINPFF